MHEIGDWSKLGERRHLMPSRDFRAAKSRTASAKFTIKRRRNAILSGKFGPVESSANKEAHPEFRMGFLVSGCASFLQKVKRTPSRIWRPPWKPLANP